MIYTVHDIFFRPIICHVPFALDFAYDVGAICM